MHLIQCLYNNYIAAAAAAAEVVLVIVVVVVVVVVVVNVFSYFEGNKCDYLDRNCFTLFFRD